MVIDDLHRRRLGRRPRDVFLMDEAGRRLASGRLPEELTGVRQLHELVAAHAEQPEQVVIGIEIDRGLWVGALSTAGYQVYAINALAGRIQRRIGGGGRGRRRPGRLRWRRHRLDPRSGRLLRSGRA
jgi:hypothetical protein